MKNDGRGRNYGILCGVALGSDWKLIVCAVHSGHVLTTHDEN